MTEHLDVISSKIERERAYLRETVQTIWRIPETQSKEGQTHRIVSDVLEKYGFEVERNFDEDTALRAEYSSRTGGGPTIALFLYYEALSQIVCGCGHNVISEANLAAAIVTKQMMETDETLSGKLVVMVVNNNELFKGKHMFPKIGSLKGIDVAFTIHPSLADITLPSLWNSVQIEIEICDKELNRKIRELESFAAINGFYYSKSKDSTKGWNFRIMEFYKPLSAYYYPDTERCKTDITAIAKEVGLKAVIIPPVKFIKQQRNSALSELYKEYRNEIGLRCRRPKPTKCTVFPEVECCHVAYNNAGREANRSYSSYRSSPGTAKEPALEAAMATVLTLIRIMRDRDMQEEIKEQLHHFMTVMFPI